MAKMENQRVKKSSEGWEEKNSKIIGKIWTDRKGKNAGGGN
jgi:hypothetical protein